MSGLVIVLAALVGGCLINLTLISYNVMEILEELRGKR
jgi:hypothetical protein